MGVGGEPGGRSQGRDRSLLHLPCLEFRNYVFAVDRDTSICICKVAGAGGWGGCRWEWGNYPADETPLFFPSQSVSRFSPLKQFTRSGHDYSVSQGNPIKRFPGPNIHAWPLAMCVLSLPPFLEQCPVLAVAVWPSPNAQPCAVTTCSQPETSLCGGPPLGHPGVQPPTQPADS